MKKGLVILIAFFLLMQACSTDFDITADWKEITVVYGLLNQNDTAHYLKINKAFLDKNTSAVTIAGISDSLYHSGLTARLIELSNEAPIDTVNLQRVDGNLEGYVKEQGTFANMPNYLYKTTKTLKADNTYELWIKTDKGNEVTAQTSIINPFNISLPTTGQKINWAPPNGQQRILWSSAKDGKVYDVTIRFYYVEIDKLTSQRDTFAIDWKVVYGMTASTIDGGETMEQYVDNHDFYTFVRSKVEPNSSVDREALGMDYIFDVGGEDFSLFMEAARAQSGIVQNQVKLEYTNIKPGKGLFSSRYRQTLQNVQLDNKAIDSLACGAITGTLGFRSITPNLCN